MLVHGIYLAIKLKPMYARCVGCCFGWRGWLPTTWPFVPDPFTFEESIVRRFDEAAMIWRYVVNRAGSKWYGSIWGIAEVELLEDRLNPEAQLHNKDPAYFQTEISLLGEGKVGADAKSV